ncbi:MAG: hypothetical protein U9R58_01930 [Chloroflexota bacterium]|nr:hypothetical protein [Chloroflexota bacterium]
MELLQEVTAQTTNYLIAGFSVIFGVMLIYAASLAVRYRNLKQEYEMLNSLGRDGTQE